MSQDLFPVESIKERFLEAAKGGPVVLTAPTGSGKSTQVPRWLKEFGRVLVIEPRRVACRSLAQFVSELEGAKLGAAVGYVVRDESRFTKDSSIVFATPGVVLRWMTGDALDGFGAVVIDEFHERSLDVDLLLALLLERYRGHLVVMSATMGAARVAAHVGGEHLHAEGRQFEVAVHYRAEGDHMLPDERGLVPRVVQAIRRVEQDGDILVFLPGKGEIKKTADALRGSGTFNVVELHGGLRLDEQRRAFERGSKRKVVLATNVAETSITIPGIRQVIDSGLVRRTRYHDGRAYLSLMPVAMDSADQRAGRAGRVAPGVCVRLWSPKARLEELTQPAVLREELDPLVLAAAACGEQVGALPFLDAPKEYAVASAKEHLCALGAVDADLRITERGQRLFGLPLDAALGNILVEGEKKGCLEDALDLVSALAIGRPLFLRERLASDGDDDPRAAGCDGLALIKVIRSKGVCHPSVNAVALKEARSLRDQLCRAFSISGKPDEKAAVDRDALVEAIVAADRRSVHIVRRRKARTSWAAGSTEISLHPASAVDDQKADAIVVLSRMGLGPRYKKQTLIASAAMPVRLSQIHQWDLAKPRVQRVFVEDNTVKVVAEFVYAGKVVASDELNPQGALARDAFAKLILEGRLFRGVLDITRERIEEKLLYDELSRRGLTEVVGDGAALERPPGDSPLAAWVAQRIEQLGVEDGGDLGLISADDFKFEELSEEQSQWIRRHYPVQVNLGDVQYKAEYDFAHKTVTLVKVAGKRKDPPSKTMLPGFGGLKVRIKHHSRVWVL